MNEKEIAAITEYIFLKSNPQKADLALVFGTRHKAAVEAAYSLFRDGMVSKIVISGGTNRVNGENEAQVMRGELIGRGVNVSDIIIEDQSTNSLENVLLSRKVIDEHFVLGRLQRIIAVVKHYHSRRALMTLRRHFPKNIELLPFTYEVYGFNRDNWFESEDGQKKVIGEWEKIPQYLVKGDIEELD